MMMGMLRVELESHFQKSIPAILIIIQHSTAKVSQDSMNAGFVVH